MLDASNIGISNKCVNFAHAAYSALIFRDWLGMPQQDSVRKNSFSNIPLFDLIFSDGYRINDTPRIWEARNAPDLMEAHSSCGFWRCLGYGLDRIR
jgi:hypothetical protein